MFVDLLESTYGSLSGGISSIGIAVLACVLGFTGAPLWLWSLFAAAALWGCGQCSTATCGSG